MSWPGPGRHRSGARRIRGITTGLGTINIIIMVWKDLPELWLSQDRAPERRTNGVGPGPSRIRFRSCSLAALMEPLSQLPAGLSHWKRHRAEPAPSWDEPVSVMKVACHNLLPISRIGFRPLQSPPPCLAHWPLLVLEHQGRVVLVPKHSEPDN